MTRSCLAAAALSLSILTPTCLAQSSDDFAVVRDRYEQLVEIIRTSSFRLTAADTPAIEALLADVSSHVAAHREDAAALAMEIQLMVWLERDPAEIDERYTRLERLRSDDIALMLSADQFRLRNELATAEEIEAKQLSLPDRFPGNEHALQLWAEASNALGRYDDVVARLESQIDPATSRPQLVAAYLDAAVNLGRYDEVLTALDTLDGRPATDDGMVRIRVRMGTLCRSATTGAAEWPAEAERRAADDARDDLPRVRLVTDNGAIVIELFEDDVPNTVANFVSLVRDGFYDGTVFHRRLENETIYGGDPNSRESVEGILGRGNPGYQIANETADEPRMHFHDTIAMHRPSGDDSAGSIFYFSMRPQPSFDTRRTVFGRVIEGLDVMRQLQRDDRIVSTEVERTRDHAYDPTVIPLPGAETEADDAEPATSVPPLPPAPNLDSDDGGSDDDGTGSSDGGTD